MSVAFADYDQDGWPDAFVTNANMPHFLFHTLGPGRRRARTPPAPKTRLSSGRRCEHVVIRSRPARQAGWPYAPWTVGWRAMAAVFNLNHHASYVHWHFFQMSVSNIVVIVLMLIVFAIAILAPFPKGGSA